MTQYLSDDEGHYLLRLARHTIEQALGVAAEPLASPPPSELLSQFGAAFVTLNKRSGELCGCIGSLAACRTLVQDVSGNAYAAAFEDPRFAPLTKEELPDVVREVSVLTCPEPLTYADPKDLVTKLRPNVDGVVIERGWHRATFLPQVWNQLPMPEEFLAHLCYKAGLSANAWRQGDLEVSTYQVQEFVEPH
jgi:AmmeMemoRadiSam system protein A